MGDLALRREVPKHSLQMAEIIEMPKLSDTMEVGTIVNWLKQEGDEVQVGDMLCEVETDKATMELENLVADGVILKIYSQEGEEAPLGAPICAIGEKGEAPPEVEKPSDFQGGADDEGPSAGGDVGHPIGDQAEGSETGRDDAPKAPVGGTPQGRKQEYVPAKEPAEAITEAPAPGGRIKASPLARRLAEEKGIPLHTIRGSGPAGRIVKADVLSAVHRGTSATTAPAAEAPGKGAPAYTGPVSLGAPIADDAKIKVTNMRKTIAKRLVESKTQIPHFYLEIEADAGALITLRAEVNEQLAQLPPEKGGMKLTVNDFILKASAEALRRVPGVNASWMGDHIAQHGSVHMAFGVAVADGLVTPVIRDAHAKSLRQISVEAKGLIGKARDKKLTPDEMSGSTFTVTNLGMYGISGFYGIINPPNAGILSVGATERKAVVNGNNEIVVAQRMAIGFSGDHRVVDGAMGAEFLTALKTIIETPALMLV